MAMEGGSERERETALFIVVNDFHICKHAILF